MGIGVSLILIAVGAVLAFAVQSRTSGFNINTVGYILLVVGAIGALIFSSSGRAGRSRRRPPAYRGGGRRRLATRSDVARRRPLVHGAPAAPGLAEAEDELGVVGHPLRRPRRVERQLELDVLDPLDLPDWLSMSCAMSGPAGQPIEVRLYVTLAFESSTSTS